MIDYIVKLNLKTMNFEGRNSALLNLPFEWITIELKSLCWGCDFDGEDCGYDDVLIVGSYSNMIDGEEWCYYIDVQNMELLEFWRLEDDY